MMFFHDKKRENLSFHIILSVILLLVGIIAYFLSIPKNEPKAAPQTLLPATVINITAKNFEYSTKEIRVKRGDRVKIVLTGEQGFHDFVIDEFNVRTDKITAKQSTAVEFQADKSGVFEFYCSVGTHRQMGMRGDFIVEE